MKPTPAQNSKRALENLIASLESLLVPQTPPPTPLAKSPTPTPTTPTVQK